MKMHICIILHDFTNGMQYCDLQSSAKYEKLDDILLYYSLWSKQADFPSKKKWHKKGFSIQILQVPVQNSMLAQCDQNSRQACVARRYRIILRNSRSLSWLWEPKNESQYSKPFGQGDHKSPYKVCIFHYHLKSQIFQSPEKVCSPTENSDSVKRMRNLMWDPFNVIFQNWRSRWLQLLSQGFLRYKCPHLPPRPKTHIHSRLDT